MPRNDIVELIVLLKSIRKEIHTSLNPNVYKQIENVYQKLITLQEQERGNLLYLLEDENYVSPYCHCNTTFFTKALHALERIVDKEENSIKSVSMCLDVALCHMQYIE